jgi:outer membrane protein
MLKSGLRACQATAVAVLALCAPVANGAETLHDALVGAYRHSGLLEQNRALLRAADEDVAQAVAALRPIITWTASATRTNRNAINTRRSSVNFSSFGTEVALQLDLTLLLWDNNRTRLGVEAAKETVLATRQALISVEQQVLTNAVRAYFDVRAATENVALRRSNLRLITEELRAARDRFEVGEVTRTDVAQAEARLAEAQSGLAAAQGSLVIAQESYAASVGRKPGQLATPGRLPRVERSIKRAKDIAVRNHPSLKEIQHRVAAADLLVEQAKRLPSPRVEAFGQARQTETFNSDQYSDNLSVGIRATGPIYRGGQLSSQSRQAVARRDQARGQLHQTRHTIRQNVGAAYAQLQVAQAQLEATEQRIRAARVAFRGVREEATLGARTTLDVLNAEQALLDAQASKIQAQADSYVAAYQVLSSMGRLTVTDLGLGIQQYDPSEYYNLVKSAPTTRSKQGQKLDRVLKSLQKD